MEKTAVVLPDGFFRVSVAVPRLRVADPSFNAAEICGLLERAQADCSQLVVFPELSLTAYSCADLFQQEALLAGAEQALARLIERSRTLSPAFVVGVPVPFGNRLFNCAAFVAHGRLAGLVPKSFIPGYKEFYEERWFSPAPDCSGLRLTFAGQETDFGIDLVFQAEADSRCTVGIELCEDLWVPVPPSSRLAQAGALVLCNLSASDEILGKAEYRRTLVRAQSGRCSAAYLYSAAGVDESTTDLVFGGQALIAEDGLILAENERFARSSNLLSADIDLERLLNERRRFTSFMEADTALGAFRRVGFRAAARPFSPPRRRIERHPFVPAEAATRDERCREIFSIQTAGLAKRIEHSGARGVVVGVSGGLDSALALLVAVRTFDLLGLPRTGVLAVTMPGFGTTDRTYRNAMRLIESLGVSGREIPINEACLVHFRDIGHDPDLHDTTYENAQARERTQLLMDLANKIGGLVIGTGDLSELALGWCTYNGDHMSMYAVNSGVPKTLVRSLVAWVADSLAEAGTRKVLLDVIDTPITPELLPPDGAGGIRQKTEDTVGPYELHDFFLYHFVRYGAPPSKILRLARAAFGDAYEGDEIRAWLVVFLKRFFSQQFKRSCLPDGPKIGTISLSPRGDWRMPSDAAVSAWIAELAEN